MIVGRWWEAVAYLLLGDLGDAPPFGFFKKFVRCTPFVLGDDFLGDDYG